MNKILKLFVVLLLATSTTLASVSAAESSTIKQELRDIAIEMITPSYGNVGDITFRNEVAQSDAELLARFNALSQEEQDIVMQLVRNNGQESALSSDAVPLNGGGCSYTSFPDTITVRDPVNQGYVTLHYGVLTSNVTNDPNGGDWICDNRIWYTTSKPYIWGNTPRARYLLGRYSTINKRTDVGQDSIIIGGNWGAYYYGLDWMNMHSEIAIWGY